MAYKAKSITSKASSACKINMDLVDGNSAISEPKKSGMDHMKAAVEKDLAPPKPASKSIIYQPPPTEKPSTDDTEKTVETEGKQSTDAIEPKQN